VAPGDRVTVKNGLQGINQPKPGGGYLRHVYYPMNAPGVYRLRLRLGKVESNEHTLRVVAENTGMTESRDVRVDGVDFTATVEPRVQAPAAGSKRAMGFGLRLGNQSGKALRFNRFDTAWPQLKSADGKALEMLAGRKDSKIPMPVTLNNGDSTTLLPGATLEWLPDGRGLRLFGVEATGGVWQFNGLTPGRYRLGFSYESTAKPIEDLLRARPDWSDAGPPFWLGKAETAEVTFEIAPAP
jgi:hypothetical protein